jgi:hypothetical protein
MSALPPAVPSENLDTCQVSSPVCILPAILLLLALMFAGLLVACSSCSLVTPSTNPTAPPNLSISVYDYTLTACNTPHNPPCPNCCSKIQTAAGTNPSLCPYYNCNPFTLTGFPSQGTTQWALYDFNEAANFDSNIAVIATDSAGVKSLNATFTFWACGTVPPNSPGGTCAGTQTPLTSFDNGGYIAPSNTLTMNATPNPGGQALTELAFPVSVTVKDLKSISCMPPSGGTGNANNGVGTLEVDVTATDFSKTSSNQTSKGSLFVSIGQAYPPSGPNQSCQ